MSFRRGSFIWLFFGVSVLFFSGCPYESDHPLTPAGEAMIDQALLGEWKPEQKDDEPLETIIILPFNERELVIVGAEGAKKEPDLLRAICSRVDGELFLSLQEVSPKGPKRWVLVNYRLLGDKLFMRTVDKALFSRGFHSSTELREFLKGHLGNPALYGSQGTRVWRRVER